MKDKKEAQRHKGTEAQRSCLGRRYRLTDKGRIKRSRDFQAVYSVRCRAEDERLIVYVRPNEVGRSRLGLSVGRKVGSAVRRNRTKRTLREAYRLSQHDLPGPCDYVMIPRAGVKATTGQYRESLMRLCSKLQRRLGKSPQSGEF